MICLKDIAKQLNLSTSVVSRVLNPNPDVNARISPETRQKVEAAARRMGYQRNRIGEFMRRGQTAVIGVFIPDFTNSLIANLLLGISEAANAAGFPLAIHSGPTPQSFLDFVQRVSNASACGVITYSQLQYNLPELDQLLWDYQQHGGRILMLNDLSEKRFPTLSMDEEQGGCRAAELLLAHSLRKLWVVAPEQDIVRGLPALRVRGVRETAQQVGVPVQLGEPPRAVVSWLKAHPGQGGVFCPSDQGAIKFMNYAAESGVQAGKDYYLVGYDDIDAASLVAPGLTTIRQPFREEGQRAVQNLIKLIYNEPITNELVMPIPIKRFTA